MVNWKWVCQKWTNLTFDKVKEDQSKCSVIQVRKFLSERWLLLHYIIMYLATWNAVVLQLCLHARNGFKYICIGWTNCFCPASMLENSTDSWYTYIHMTCLLTSLLKTMVIQEPTTMSEQWSRMDLFAVICFAVQAKAPAFLLFLPFRQFC